MRQSWEEVGGILCMFSIGVIVCTGLGLPRMGGVLKLRYIKI